MWEGETTFYLRNWIFEENHEQSIVLYDINLDRDIIESKWLNMEVVTRYMLSKIHHT